MIMTLTRRAFGALAIAAAVFAGGALLQPETAAARKFTTQIFQTKDGVAIRGYDPVAYFTMGKPTKGSAEHAYRWRNATWHFANAKHLAMFKADPEKYAPQYGGYCAYGLAQGGLVPIDPDAWAVYNGKLYLNYDKRVQSWWDKDRNGFIVKANKNADKAFKGLK